MTSSEPRNPVVNETVLRAYPTWKVREYKDGWFDATQLNGLGLTRGVDSFREAVDEVREMEQPSWDSVGDADDDCERDSPAGW